MLPVRFKQESTLPIVDILPQHLRNERMNVHLTSYQLQFSVSEQFHPCDCVAAGRRPSCNQNGGASLLRERAKGKIKNDGGVRAGRFTNALMASWLLNIELRGGGLDESPDCYKRLPSVLAEHGDSIRILHSLTALGVATAGSDVVDPFKD